MAPTHLKDFFPIVQYTNMAANDVMCKRRIEPRRCILACFTVIAMVGADIPMLKACIYPKRIKKCENNMLELQEKDIVYLMDDLSQMFAT